MKTNLTRGSASVVCVCLSVALLGVLPTRSQAAGVTVITHGFGGDAQGWVLGMGQRISRHATFTGTNVICYELTVVDSGNLTVSWRRIAGGYPTNDPTAEIVIKLDWGALAGFFNQYDTFEVADAVVPKFLETNFISELGGRALAELPLHLIGHSRGGSLVCQMARLFGREGVWVDHVTTLDPHPVNNDGNSDPLTVTDAPLRIYENVLFADNYYQDFGGYPSGQFMASSYNRRLTTLPGGYSSAHSDTHLWYHATIDLRNPASDTEATLTGADRTQWFTGYEQLGARAGFHYSRIANGNRLSTNRPAGPGTDAIALGMNQRWDFGAGQAPNRTPLNVNRGQWPNIIRLGTAGTNFIARGDTNSIQFDAQWAQPAASNATVSLFLDTDFNPYNGNEWLVKSQTQAGTGSNNIAMGAIEFTSTNSNTGQHLLFARISNGTYNRYLYSSEPLTIVSSAQPPTLAIAHSNTTVHVTVNGIPGQRIVLESSTNLVTWTALATNWLTAPTWSRSEPMTYQRCFRAVLR